MKRPAHATISQLRAMINTLITYLELSQQQPADLVQAIREKRLKFADTLTTHEAEDILTYFAENPIRSALALPHFGETGVLALTRALTLSLQRVYL